jgi:hypothetical protein
LLYDSALWVIEIGKAVASTVSEIWNETVWRAPACTDQYRYWQLYLCQTYFDHQDHSF